MSFTLIISNLNLSPCAGKLKRLLAFVQICNSYGDKMDKIVFLDICLPNSELSTIGKRQQLGEAFFGKRQNGDGSWVRTRGASGAGGAGSAASGHSQVGHRSRTAQGSRST